MKKKSDNQCKNEESSSDIDNQEEEQEEEKEEEELASENGVEHDDSQEGTDSDEAINKQFRPRYHYSGWKFLQTLWESKCVQNTDPEMSKMLLSWLLQNLSSVRSPDPY